MTKRRVGGSQRWCWRKVVLIVVVAVVVEVGGSERKVVIEGSRFGI